MRCTYDVVTGNKANYEAFAKDNPGISLKEYRQVAYEYGREYFQELVETGDALRLPHGFGFLCMVKKKNRLHYVHPETGELFNILPMDYKATRATKEKCFHNNSHTDGYRCSVKWDSRHAKIFLPNLWEFSIYRNIKRNLIAKYLKTTPNAVDNYVTAINYSYLNG